jgi:hypothetical protein
MTMTPETTTNPSLSTHTETGGDPDEIRRDIESTRRELSHNVDALTEKVSPPRIVARRMDRAKNSIGTMKERVMGVASSTTGSAGSGLSTAGDKATSAAATASETVSAAPDTARQKTQGNPLAAGVIAFGAGWLLSSLLPATEREQQAATAVKDKASEHSDALKEPLAEAAGALKENLREPAAEAVESVKSTAADATANVQDEAQSAKANVSGGS